jgi:NTE family protein
MARSEGALRKINLALQGGGSHGAYTWGVLDRLLEDDRLDVEAVTGTSAGAVNAVALASGYGEGGAAGARATLDKVWTAVGTAGELSPFRRTVMDALFGYFGLGAAPLRWWADFVTRQASPYQWNPLNLNPLRDVLEDTINWSAIQTCKDFKLFLSATNVRTGRIKVFDKRHITVDAVLASACLPYLFQAVEINGHAYWDGGYMGNPALFPLFYLTESRDILLIQINPFERADVPDTAYEITNRLNEISFNSALMGELRAIEFVGRLIDDGTISQTRYKKMHVHMIDGGTAMADLGADTKLNADMAFLLDLKARGRQAAETWLDHELHCVGNQSGLNLRQFLIADAA